MRLQSAFLALAVAGLPVPGLASDQPGYQNDRLSVPRVDTAGQVGQYQDVVLQRGAQGGFSIVGLQELGQGRLFNLQGISKVEAAKAGSEPASVFLRVSGTDPSCDYAGPLRVHQRREGSRFDINISALHVHPLGSPVVCTADIRNYRMTVPLEVYGLAAGTYTFTVNGGFAGQFTLDRENRFADDCDVYRAGRCP